MLAKMPNICGLYLNVWIPAISDYFVYFFPRVGAMKASTKYFVPPPNPKSPLSSTNMGCMKLAAPYHDHDAKGALFLGFRRYYLSNLALTRLCL
jgi:hypothetical protein